MQTWIWSIKTCVYTEINSSPLIIKSNHLHYVQRRVWERSTNIWKHRYHEMAMHYSRPQYKTAISEWPCDDLPTIMPACSQQSSQVRIFHISLRSISPTLRVWICWSARRKPCPIFRSLANWVHTIHRGWIYSAQLFGLRAKIPTQTPVWLSARSVADKSTWQTPYRTDSSHFRSWES